MPLCPKPTLDAIAFLIAETVSLLSGSTMESSFGCVVARFRTSDSDWLAPSSLVKPVFCRWPSNDTRLFALANDCIIASSNAILFRVLRLITSFIFWWVCQDKSVDLVLCHRVTRQLE